MYSNEKVRPTMGKKKYSQIKYFDKEEFNYYYGIPHCHTSFSTGRGTPYEAFEHGKKAGLDFMCITDHNSYLKDTTSTGDNAITKWQATHNSADKIRKKYEKFIPLTGFECKSNPFGDFNIINSSTFFSGVLKDLKLLALWMLNNPSAFVTINHPHKNVKTFEYNPIINKIITSVEVGNGNPQGKYTRHEKHYYYLLDQGWKLGAINGQDNHRFNFGDSDNLTVCIANNLNSYSLVDAFRSRRTYSTESRFLKMYFTINEYFMGEEILLDNERIRFMIFAEDIKHKIQGIQIITNKGTIVKSIDSLNINSLKYLYEHKYCEGESYYIIKVIQDSDKIAYSSPIFIQLNDNLKI